MEDLEGQGTVQYVGKFQHGKNEGKKAIGVEMDTKVLCTRNPVHGMVNTVLQCLAVLCSVLQADCVTVYADSCCPPPHALLCVPIPFITPFATVCTCMPCLLQYLLLMK